MYIFLLIIHVIVCFVLVAVVLLQAGRGGGFSDMMGGAQPQSIFGTQTNEFMTRATEVCAVLFIVTSLSLGILSIQRGKSLMEKKPLLHSIKQTVPSLPVETNAKTVAVPTAPATVAPVAPEKTADEKKV